MAGSPEISGIPPQLKKHDNSSYHNFFIDIYFYLMAPKMITSLLIRHKISAA
jgi:hypothetical protein